MIRIIFVLVLFAAACMVGLYLPHFKAMDFFAILLMLLAGLMLGFALADGRPDKIFIELLVAAGFVVLTLLGMWKWTWLIPMGFVFQASWCLVHHFSFTGARIRAWFSPLCALFSILLAIFIYIVFFSKLIAEF